MRQKLILLAIFTLFLTSCANKSVVTSYSSLAGYKYVVIEDTKDSGGNASLMNFKVQLQQAIQETRLEEVKTKDVDNLTEEQKKQLIVLQLSGSQAHDNSVATINVVDYKTERVLGSCNGVFGLSFSTYGDMNGAIKKSIRAFKRMLNR